MEGPTVAVVVGATCGALLMLAILILLWRILTRKKSKESPYEKISPDHGSLVRVDNGSFKAPNMSMKQIPFTVPSVGTPGTPPVYQRSDSKGLDDASLWSGGSEPTTPISKRPSVEIPGAYALGVIDPSLYKITDEDDDYDIEEDHLGRVWFAVEYEREAEKLKVTLIKAKNLPSRSFGNTSGCDPFVRIYLIPDERRYLQSKFRKKTCNPKFEESYIFQVSHRAFQDRILKFTVFDVDRHKRHNVIGHALYPLREHDCDSDERVVIWRDLEREVTESTSNRGEIMVSLTYNNHVERLTVGIFEGKAFKKPEGSTTVDSYVKICLTIQNKSVKTKKTEVLKKDENPTFNESFTFKLNMSALDTTSVTISAMQHCSGHKDKTIGRVVLGSFMFARGKELDHWNEMVANQKEQVTHLHSLT